MQLRIMIMIMALCYGASLFAADQQPSLELLGRWHYGTIGAISTDKTGNHVFAGAGSGIIVYDDALN